MPTKPKPFASEDAHSSCFNEGLSNQRGEKDESINLPYFNLNTCN